MATPVGRDRRHQRRLETIEQVLDTAVEVMADQGVAGLTLGEVARRMGIRPPSLYGYFDGKHALHDALFERGRRQLSATMHAAHAAFGTATARRGARPAAHARLDAVEFCHVLSGRGTGSGLLAQQVPF